jgi:hypothetical protein
MAAPGIVTRNKEDVAMSFSVCIALSSCRRSP